MSREFRLARSCEGARPADRHDEMTARRQTVEQQACVAHLSMHRFAHRQMAWRLPDGPRVQPFGPFHTSPGDGAAALMSDGSGCFAIAFLEYDRSVRSATRRPVCRQPELPVTMGLSRTGLGPIESGRSQILHSTAKTNEPPAWCSP